MSACCFTRSANEPASATSDLPRFGMSTKTKPNLNKVPVTRQDIYNLQFLHNCHGGLVGKGNVRLIAKSKAQIKGPPKTSWRNLLDPYEGRFQQSFCESRCLLERPAPEEPAKRFVENEVRREDISSRLGCLRIYIRCGLVLSIFGIFQHEPSPSIYEELHAGFSPYSSSSIS